jgi:DNA-binding cell septation regulator SpoVG
MKITIEHFPGERPQFNVCLASGEGKEPFLTIKGCRIVEGSKGPFISWPATKNEKTGKYWNHVYGSDAFAAEVMKEAHKGATKHNDDQPPF